MSCARKLVAAWCVFVCAVPSLGEDAMMESLKVDGAEAQEVSDETQQIMSQLTIAMSAEVIDERTFTIRDSSKGSKQMRLCLGNVGPTPRGSLDDGEYAEKVRIAKEALVKLVDKQMILYKPAPDAVQSANSSGVVPNVLADVWSTDGMHISSFLKKEGHLSDDYAYDTDLGKDILTVASETEKKESYKKLEEAMKESEKAKKEAAKASQAQTEDEVAESESLGVPGWISVALVSVIAFGAATNFGRPSSKKVNLNRKRGWLERFWMKIKGA